MHSAPGCEVNDRAAKMLVPHAFLPVQYFDRIRRRTILTGERLLMLAVLEQGVDEYLKHSRLVDLRCRRIFAHAAQWIESEDRSHLYCFANICDHLGLDAECLRRGLRHWRPESHPVARSRSTAVADAARSAETAVA